MFNKCTTISDDLADSHEFTVTLDYEFLEDIYAEWVTTVGDDVSIASDISPLTEFDSDSLFSTEGQKTEYKSIDTKTEKEKLRELERKKNHPLMLMVRYLIFLIIYVPNRNCLNTEYLCLLFCFFGLVY